MEFAQDRINVLNKIEICEKNKRFDLDIEDDPPAKNLMPNQVDYLNKKLSSKFLTWHYNNCAKKFIKHQIKRKNLIIDKIEGIENFNKVSGGAILTCNHFNPFDSFAVKESIKGTKNKMYTVIREGNYTSFKGFYGKIFKHCNTLPLSSNKDTMKLFVKAMQDILNKGNKVLIFPEQAMWWNYKKPRPLKNGAYNLAVKNNVPIIPFFITFLGSNEIGKDGFTIKKYTVHILEPIYPNPNLSLKENIEQMKQLNFNAWQKVYEQTYGIKLKYLTKEE